MQRITTTLQLQVRCLACLWIKALSGAGVGGWVGRGGGGDGCTWCTCLLDCLSSSSKAEVDRCGGIQQMSVMPA
jgi:hypothetical protein